MPTSTTTATDDRDERGQELPAAERTDEPVALASGGVNPGRSSVTQTAVLKLK